MAVHELGNVVVVYGGGVVGNASREIGSYDGSRAIVTRAVSGVDMMLHQVQILAAFGFDKALASLGSCASPAAG